MIHPSRLVLAAAGLLTTLPAVAADADLKALRAEIAQMKQAYEQRIEALEKRLGEAESTSSQAKAAADKAATQAARAGEGKASAFNPEIGLVLQGQARRMQDVPERTVSGYWPAGHDHGGDKRGFSLQHSELILSANIDPSFRGVARFAITGDNEWRSRRPAFPRLAWAGALPHVPAASPPTSATRTPGIPTNGTSQMPR